MHIQTDRALIPAASPSVRYLQVRISAPPAPAPTSAPRPAVEVALVLDRSGSMDGSKITMARKAVTHAIRLLKPADHMAVVCYDDRVDTVLARTPASAEAKGLVYGRLAEIDARGSTNLSGGWLAGAQELRPGAGGPELGGPESGGPEPSGPESGGPESGGPAGVRRVLLLTDGLANAGAVDPHALAATAATLRDAGITTSTFGIGADFDEELLSRLATQGGGHFYYIEKAGQIPDFFASELGEALDVVARDAVFEVMCSPGAAAVLLNDLPTERVEAPEANGRRGLRVRLGDLVADQELTLTVAVHVQAPPPLGAGVEVMCRLADRDHVLYGQPMFVDWAAASAADNDAQPVSQDVVRAVAVAMSARARSQALAANRRGLFDDARRLVDEAIAALGALAPTDATVGALIAQLEHDRDGFGEVMSAREMKQRHFASYSVAYSRESGGKARRRVKTS